ncbi:MAG: NAD+ kinase [Verrucomicrobiales bacterium]|jgi:NAD+ kinase
MAATHIGVTANISKPNAREVLSQLRSCLLRRDLRVSIEKGSACLLDNDPNQEEGLELRELAKAVDLLIVLGGDGTILRAVRRTIGVTTPIMGINIGTLGFLTCATQHEVDQVGDWIQRDYFKLSKRSLLEAAVSLVGEEQATYFGLNEVTVCRENVSRLIQLETHINGEYLNHYSADGLIISTPTGSTAYSLSAGGPIIDPESGVFVITPICPHAMSNRSMVVPNDAVIEVTPVEIRDQVVLTLDGRTVHSVQPHSRIHIRRAEHQVELAFLPEQSFYRTLRHKLHWHGSNIG